MTKKRDADEFFVTACVPTTNDGNSHEYLGQSIGSCTCNVWLGRVEGNVKDTFIKLLAVSCDFLDTRFIVQIPQPYTAVMACEEKNED
jgi:hypothetical protein